MVERPLSIDEICEYLGISRDTFFEWIKTNELPAHTPSRLGECIKEHIGELSKKGAR